MTFQEKIEKIIEHYNGSHAQYDDIPQCILDLTIEENLEFQRMVESGELVIEGKGLY